jgi:hypothetical protein
MALLSEPLPTKNLRRQWQNGQMVKNWNLQRRRPEKLKREVGEASSPYFLSVSVLSFPGLR